MCDIARITEYAFYMEWYVDTSKTYHTKSKHKSLFQSSKNYTNLIKVLNLTSAVNSDAASTIEALEMMKDLRVDDFNAKIGSIDLNLVSTTMASISPTNDTDLASALEILQEILTISTDPTKFFSYKTMLGANVTTATCTSTGNWKMKYGDTDLACYHSKFCFSEYRSYHS